MLIIIVLLSMMFCHLVDDYYLQGILASMKQKKWWEENAPQKLYRNDYFCALIEHAFSWTFMIMLPIIVCIISGTIEISETAFEIAFGVNWVIHAVVDDLKANEHQINLCVDQTCHLIQIIITWIVLVV